MKSSVQLLAVIPILLTSWVLTSCDPTDNQDDPETESQWQALGDFGFHEFIKSIASDQNGNIIVAGDFINSNGEYFVGRWEKSTNTWSELGSGSSPYNHGVRHPMATDPSGNIYAQGMNGSAGTSPNHHVITWSETSETWTELGGAKQPLFNNGIFAIVTDQHGNVYASGDSLVGWNNPFIAMWDKNTNSWKKLGYFIGSVDCLAIDNTGAVYATGTIEKGQPGSCISKWDGNTWSIIGGYGSKLGGEIKTIAVDNAGNVYAGGSFFNNGSFYNMAKCNKSTWEYMKIMNPEQSINAVITDASGYVYAAGDFTDSKGNFFVARWDGSEWIDLGSLNANAPINALAFDEDGDIYAGGQFTGKHSHYVAFY